MRILAAVALVLVSLAPEAQAEVLKHPTSGLQFELPGGWKTRTNAGNLVAEPPDGGAYVSFTVIEDAAVKTYVEKWAEGMAKLTDLQVDVNAEVSEVNGLQHVYSVGSAVLEGKPIQWDLTIVKGGTKVLAIMALGEDLDGPAIQQMYATIRRIGQPATKGQDRGTNAPLEDDGLDAPSEGEDPPPLKGRDEGNNTLSPEELPEGDSDDSTGYDGDEPPPEDDPPHLGVT